MREEKYKEKLRNVGLAGKITNISLKFIIIFYDYDIYYESMIRVLAKSVNYILRLWLNIYLKMYNLNA